MTHEHPKLKHFYNDMNKHPRAKYTRIGDRYVLELDSNPTGWWLTAWRAVKEGDEYVDAHVLDNFYEWDAVGREEFEDREDGLSRLRELTTVNKLSDWCAGNPYEGPRRPYSERCD